MNLKLEGYNDGCTVTINDTEEIDDAHGTY
ncbi:hypothetical protein J2T13_004159 [Paenibacillus sp. DS2015]